MRNKLWSISLLILGIFFWANSIWSQNNLEGSLDYKDELILDSDLDGLTDLGEKDIFKTDYLDPDTDSDGFYDGTEVLGNSDPLSDLSPTALKTVNESVQVMENEVPWTWYIARVTGLISFFLLYIVMFLGLSIRTPILNKFLKPMYSLNIHAWLSVQALILVLVHGGVLIFDKYARLNLLDITVPFVNKIYGIELAFGILAMYLMVLLIVSSYLRKFINYKVWRISHFLNIPLYGMAVYHGLYLGTDLASGLGREIFIYANIFLVFIILVNIFTRIIKFFKRNRQEV